MNVRATALAEVHHFDDQASAFGRDVIDDLSRHPKRLSPKYFYDAAGSELFEQITLLPEYYPTRTELAILRECGRAIAAIIPKDAALVEFGAGATTKVRLLLTQCALGAYVPVDISGDFLRAQAEALRADFPALHVYPVAADFTAPFELPETIKEMPKVGFFPGSTLGNFEPHEASAFLRSARQILGPGARMVIGVDLEKDERVLYDAYNDFSRSHGALQPECAASHQPRTGRRFRRRRVHPSRGLQPRPSSHRDAPDQQEGADRPRAGQEIFIPSRRKHSHRKQLQIQFRTVLRACPWLGLEAGAIVDGRGRHVLGSCAGGLGLSFFFRQPFRPRSARTRPQRNRFPDRDHDHQRRRQQRER